MMNGTEYDVDPAAQLFDQFISAVTCKSILGTFHDLCDSLGLTNTDHRNFYKQLKSKLTSWKAKSLWTKLDKRASHRDYRKMEACPNTKVLIIGAGPCGMRMAIEVALMGGKAVVVEKRDRFSRNNVLHLWNYLISDLKNLGAKKFFGKFCAGSIEHISIRQLQCILMKVALLLGVEVHVNVAFEELIEPPEDQSSPMGWRCRVTPSNHPVSEYQFDVLIGADGKRNTVPGFKRKEFRGKLAIAITANFINRNSNAEARVEEISGVAFIFNQKFFLDLKEKTSIDLENIVYYKDETHYFVMTAKKASLLEKGVLKEDYNDTVQLLSRENVDQDALLTYAKEAADFSTNHQLPCLDYAVNHYGQADIAMFDFTSMFAAENACRALERHGHKLAIAIVGDSLLEPFWPTGSGCARGFLGVFDAAWMIKSWASGKMSPLEVIAERESIYQLLSQTTPENLHKNHGQYSIDPNTRYPNLNLKNRLKLAQVKHLYDGPLDNLLIEEAVDDAGPAKRSRICGTTVNNDLIDSYSLLRWCQRVLNTGRFRNVHVVDFAGSWRNGLAFCALIHAFRPTLLDFNLLMESDVAKNNQLAFDVAEKDLGVPPVMTGEDMAKSQIPDKLTLVSYISQLYAIFRKEPLPTVDANLIFCQQTGCYVRKAEPEDGEVSTIKVEDNPFYGVSLAAVRTSNQSTPAMLRSDSQLSYDRPGIPDWVRYAASQASASEGSSVSDTDSDSTTADGSITVWKKRGRRRTCSSGNSDDEVKRPADKTFVKDWVKTSSRRWSDSSDHTSTDDEQDRPISVKALAKFYDGPRGYSVSHRPRSKKVSAKREVKPECVETSSDVLANLSETQIGNGAVILDDSAFKTFTQDDMDQSNPQFTMDGTVLTGDDLFRTLTQGDDLKVGADDDPSDPAPFPLKEAKPGDISVTRTEEDVQEAKTESAVQSLDIDILKEECSGDDKALERQVDVEMQDAKIDSDPSKLASPWDDSSCREECSGETLALTKEATSDVDMRETRTDCEPSSVAPLPCVNLPKEEDVEARTKSLEDETVAAVDMKGGMRRFVGDDSAPSEEEEDADVDSSDEETVVPLDFKSLKKKFSGDASRTPEETLRGKRRAKSGSQQPDVRRQVKSVVPRYRHSYTGGKVPLPGPASSSESSTDDASDMASAKEALKQEKYPGSEFKGPGATQATEQSVESLSSTSNTSSTDTVLENTDVAMEHKSDHVEFASIDFRASKRKFLEAAGKESKKVDRRSSFRSPQYPQGNSYMDRLKESHPQAADKMALGHGESHPQAADKMALGHGESHPLAADKMALGHGESHPLVADKMALGHGESHPLAADKMALGHGESHPLAADKMALGHGESHPLAADKMALGHGESHPRAADKMALGHGERKEVCIKGDREESKGYKGTEVHMVGGGSETPERRVEAGSDMQPDDGGVERKLEFIIPGEYRSQGGVHFDGTFSQLETESSTDIVVPVTEDSVAEIDALESQGPCVKQRNDEGENTGSKTDASDEDTEDKFYDAVELSTQDKNNTLTDATLCEALYQTAYEAPPDDSGVLDKDNTLTDATFCKVLYQTAYETPPDDSGVLDKDNILTDATLCKVLYQTAYETPPDDSGASKFSRDTLCDDDDDDEVFATAVGTQLASRLNHVSVSEDMDLTVQVQRRHHPEPSPKSLRSPSRKISLLHRLSNRFSKTKRVSAATPGKLKKEVCDAVDNKMFGKAGQNMDIMDRERSVELTKYSKLPMEEIANKLFVDKKPEDLPKGKDNVQSGVSVTAMAEILASKFRGEEPAAQKKMKTPGVLVAAKPESEFCVFCLKRVYIMERMSAEGVFFHRGCLRCDYCNTNLRLNNYSCEREMDGEVKFYCYRHANADQRIRLKRKRIIYDDDGSKENIPTVVTMSMSKTGKDNIILPPQKKEETPKKGSALSPLMVPEDPYEKAKKTPERVEFENTFEGLEEESEEEQFEHNLRASFSSDKLLDGEEDYDESDTDSESGAEDEVLVDQNDSDISKSMTWEEACQLAENWNKRHSRENLASAGMDEGEEGGATYSRLVDEGEEEEEEEDSTEVEVSEYETEEETTDVETEEENTESREESAPRSENTRSDGTFQHTTESVSPLKSPSVSAVVSARANFFATPPEPVRIDAVRALGLTEQQKAQVSLEEEPSDRTQTDKTDNQVSEISEFEQNPEQGGEDAGTDEDVLDVDIEDEDEDEAKLGSAMSNDEGEEADGEEEMETESEGEGDRGQKEADLDKTAVSRAMEQLLKDMDNRGSVDSEQGEGRVVLTDSGEEEEEVFGEGERDGEIGEDTEMAVLRSVRDMDDTGGDGEDGGTLQQVLQEVLDMDEKKEDVHLRNIDDSFVTRRRKKKLSGKSYNPPGHVSDSDTSFTISTPSQNSSTSSLNDEFENNKHYLGDEDDLKPDADMLRDYTVTLSTALDESYSESEMPLQNQPEEEEELNKTIQGDETLNDSTRSGNDSVYLTPTVGASKEEQAPSSGSDVFLTPEVTDTKPDVLETPKAPSQTDKLSPKKLIKISIPTPKKAVSPTLVKKSVSKPNNKTSPPTKSKRIILSPVKITTEPEPKVRAVPKPAPRKSDSKLTSKVKTDTKPIPKISTSKTDTKLSPRTSAGKTESKISPKPAPRKLPIPPNVKGQSSSPRSPATKTRANTSTTSDSSPSFSRPTASSRAKKWSDTDSREGSTSPGSSQAKTPRQNKTKISVDRNVLLSDSSSEILTSDGTEGTKKKIPLDKSLVKSDNLAQKSFDEGIEDIPFADESELDERFYTPATSVKARVLPVPKEDTNVRKRLLPSPPKNSGGVPPANQILEIQKAQKERNKIKIREAPQKKEDEGSGGVQCVNKTFQNPVVPRQGKKSENSERDRRSTSYSSMDPSTSDMVTDSDDSRLYGLHTPTSSAPESENSLLGSKGKKKKKGADKTFIDKEKKRKSLLSKLLPIKSPEKTLKDRSSTPTLSDSSSSATKKKKTPKSDKKKRTKTKDIADSSLSDNLKDLRIGSVFTTDLSKLPGNRHHMGSTLPIAPKAEVDEFSDSGESMMSTSTLHGRKSFNLTDKPDDRVSRRIQKAAVKQHKQAEQKRLRMAQEIQRKLEEVDVKQRELEQRGIIVEKALRGEGPDADKEEAGLMQEWFNLVHDKNSLVRYESELMVRAKELELEDRQARLENQLRERMNSGDLDKSDAEIVDEKNILDELLEVVEQRDSLVAMLEEDRLREQEEDKDLEEVMLKKGFALSPICVPDSGKLEVS